LSLAGCTERVALGPEAIQGQTPDATIAMHEVQAPYIGSGSGGGGVSTLEATGEVYNFRDLAPSCWSMPMLVNPPR